MSTIDVRDESRCARLDTVPYAATVLSWSASWYALKVNSGCSVSPPVTIHRRFSPAAALMFPFVALLLTTMLEGYAWIPLGLPGAVPALAGNRPAPCSARRDAVLPTTAAPPA